MIVKSQIISLLNDALNQTARLRKGGDQLVYFCKCGHYKRKLEVLLEDGPGFGIWHCWVCGKSGNLGKLLSLFECKRSYTDKLYALTKDIRIVRARKSRTLSTDVVLPEEFHPLSKPKTTPEYKNALAYVKRRGILPEDIIRYNIGYCDKGEYENYIIIPSYNSEGVLNFFMGRCYYDTPNYFPHKKPNVPMTDIIGLELFVNWNEPIILVEGIFNAITIRRNAIPMFGKYPSKKLYESLIVNNIKEIYIFLDNDAEKEALDICEKFIRLGITPHFVEACGGKDASEIGFDKSWECIKNAKEVDFCFLLDKQLNM